MSERQILDQVYHLIDVLFKSQIVDDSLTLDEQIAIAEDVFCDFFAMLENLKLAESSLDLNSIEFEHHVMWYSIYCEMLKKQSLNIRDLDEDQILAKFHDDLK